MSEPGFWDDQDKAQTVISESNVLKDVVENYMGMNDAQEDLEMTLELLRDEFDEEMQDELGTDLKAFKKGLKHSNYKCC